MTDFLQDLISFHHKCNGTDCNLSKNNFFFLVATFALNTQCLNITQNVAFSVFRKLGNLIIFGIFNKLLSTQNVNS